MSPADVAGLAALLDGTSIAELTLTEGGETITLRRGAGGAPSPRTSPGGRGSSAEAVAAPCPGVFLRRHPLRAGELATVGQDLETGAVLGLLRVGPLLVEIRAPRAGTLLSADAADGALVGYGTALFRIATGEPA